MSEQERGQDRRIISFEIPGDLLRDLEALSKRMDCSRSLIIRWAIHDYLQFMTGGVQNGTERAEGGTSSGGDDRNRIRFAGEDHGGVRRD